MERRNEESYFATASGLRREHVSIAVLFAVLALGITASWADTNMEEIKRQWRAHNYQNVLAPLKDYLTALNDDARAFEADYIMATSLTSLPQHHREGCRYFLAMVQLYNRRQPFLVDGHSVTIQSAMQGSCPQELASLDPPPPQPGVSVSPITIAFKRSKVLEEVQAPPPASGAYKGQYKQQVLGIGQAKAALLIPETYFRLQLKHGGQYLDADHCTATLNLNPGSDWENGACQLWRLVSDGAGYYRLQLKHGGQYLDADHCTTSVHLNPVSTWENGACQLWRMIPDGSGYNHLQLKHGGLYLDADHCTTAVHLNPNSTWENGACQLWRLVPER